MSELHLGSEKHQLLTTTRLWTLVNDSLRYLEYYYPKRTRSNTQRITCQKQVTVIATTTDLTSWSCTAYSVGPIRYTQIVHVLASYRKCLRAPSSSPKCHYIFSSFAPTTDRLPSPWLRDARGYFAEAWTASHSAPSNRNVQNKCSIIPTPRELAEWSTHSLVFRSTSTKCL